MLRQLTKYDLLRRKVGDTEGFERVLNKLASENINAASLLSDIQSLRDEKIKLPKGLEFAQFKTEVMWYYDYLVFTLQFCVEMYKDICNEKDSDAEDFEYLYSKYSGDYDKFIEDIEYIVMNIDNYVTKRQVRIQDNSEIPNIDLKVPYLPPL